MQKVSNSVGIWKFESQLPPIAQEFKFSLGEGSTELANEGDLYFKLESQNPTGSVKDRSLAYQIAAHASARSKHLVQSSSGNAAISAMEYAKLHNIPLSLFLSDTANESKLKQLQECENLHLTPTPLGDSLIFAQNNSYPHLRQSRDPLALPGYWTIAFELFENLGDKLSGFSIFFPVSSGTTLVGVFQGLQKLVEEGQLSSLPQFFAVQNQVYFPVAEQFLSQSELPSKIDKSLASALVSPATPRLSEITNILRETNGSALVISEADLIKSWEQLESFGIDSSAEGALALAGALNCKNTGRTNGEMIIMITGKRYD